VISEDYQLSLPAGYRHEIIAGPAMTDAKLYRLMHNGFRINLKKEFMRKRNVSGLKQIL
jgi:hypothetical protein